MTVFVTGVNGQLGHDVMNELYRQGIEAMGSDITDQYAGLASDIATMSYISMDITDKTSVSQVLYQVHPDAIIHCAAWTAVDAAEDEENQEKVHAINAEGTRTIAAVAKKLDAKLLYLSTDYVFDGQGVRPWEPDDKCYAPLSVYGQSKLDGELAISELMEKFFIVRIAWVFGLNGEYFIKIMINVGNTHDEVRVVNDLVGTQKNT